MNYRYFILLVSLILTNNVALSEDIFRIDAKFIPVTSKRAKSVRVPILLPKENKAEDSFLITKLINTSELSVQKITLGKFGANPKITLKNDRTLFYASIGSFKKRTFFSGFVKLNPKLKSIPTLKVKKIKTSKPVTKRLTLKSVASAKIDEGIARTTDRDSDFSISGPGTSSWMALAGRDVISTGVASANCYNKEDGFVLIDTSREFQQARSAELALCQSGLADKSTCFDPSLYQPPNASIRGNMVSTGTTISISLSFIDESGSEAAASTIEGDLESFISLLESAGQELGKKICEARGLRVSLKADAANSNNCSFTDTGRCGCSEDGPAQGYYWEGGSYSGEMKGPVDSIFELSFASSESKHDSIDCGSWSNIPCADSSLKICCKRESSAQPSSTNYTTRLSFPPKGRRCHCENTDYETDLTSKVSKGRLEKSEKIHVRCVTG